MVKSMTIESVTSKDGKLSLGEIDTGLFDTRVKVLLMIDRSTSPAMSDQDLSKWSRFVDRTEGCIDDPSFHRQPHGVLEPIPSFDAEE